jgi:tetratricopeptide (TPR) repeat protein
MPADKADKQALSLAPALLLALLAVLFLSSCSTLPDRNSVSGLYFNLGNKELESGNYDAAVKKYSESLFYAPDNRSAAYNKAVALAQNRKYDEAEEQFRKLLAEDPENIYLLDAISWNYYQAGLLEQALASYELLLSLYPAYSKARYDVVRIALSLEKFDFAQEQIDYLFLQSGIVSETLWYQAELLYMQAEPDAVDWYEAVLEEGGYHDQAAERLQQIIGSLENADEVIALGDRLLNSSVEIEGRIICSIAVRLLGIPDERGFDYLDKAVSQGCSIEDVTTRDLSQIQKDMRARFLAGFLSSIP